MFSPGKWHLDVPSDPVENYQFRRAILLRAAADPNFRTGLMEVCRQDILFWLNTFGWQFNPKKKGVHAVGPFIAWDFQEEAIRKILWCYEENRSAVIEKSREMGATWLFLFIQDWLCLFHPYVQTLNISKSADAVDCKSNNSLFAKVRFIHRFLPDWMKGDIVENQMYFGYKRTNSEMSGEASTGRAGVSGRASVIFVDEFSKIKEATEVRERTANTADCRFFNSTHEGQDTEFFKLTQTPEIIKIVMHWTQHPEKRRGLYRYDSVTNQIVILDKTYPFPPDYQFAYSEEPLGGPYPGLRSPWYDAKCIEIGSKRGRAVELDIDVGGSVSQHWDAMLIRTLRLQFSRDPDWVGDVAVDWDSGQPLGLVEREDGPLKLWLAFKPDGTIPRAPYGAGADISTGQGATNSCLSIGNAATGEKVLEYANPNIKEERFAAVAVALCWLFLDESGQPAKFGWEHQGPGITFGKRVIELGYRRIHMRASGLSIGGMESSEVPGWFPSPDTKDDLLRELMTADELRTFINHSDYAFEERAAYKYSPDGHIIHPSHDKHDDPTGARINHGDRVIADGIANMMMKSLGVERKKKRDEDPEITVGSLAWRRMLDHNQRKRSTWAS